jgi:hypothetical protein
VETSFGIEEGIGNLESKTKIGVDVEVKGFPDGGTSGQHDRQKSGALAGQ